MTTYLEVLEMRILDMLIMRHARPAACTALIADVICIIYDHSVCGVH
jgi:hypothetical protein